MCLVDSDSMDVPIMATTVKSERVNVRIEKLVS
jgi:hypothetical protein